MKVNYDSKELTLIGITTKRMICNDFDLKSANKDTGLVSFAGYDGDSCVDDGTLFELVFSVNADAISGNTEISISKNPNAAAALKNNDDVLDSSVTFVAGTVAINGISLGPVVKVLNGTAEIGSYDTLGEAVSQFDPTNSSGNVAMILRDSAEETVNYGRIDKVDLGGYSIDTLNMIGTIGENSIYSIYMSTTGDGIINGSIGTLNVEGDANTAKNVSLVLGNDLSVGTINCSGGKVTLNIKGSTIDTLTCDGIYSLKIDDATILNMSVTNSPVTIYTGTFGFDPTPYKASNTSTLKYVVKNNGDGTYSVAEEEYEIYRVGDKSFSDYGDATSEADSTGNPIVLGADFTSSAIAGGSLSGNKSVTLDLNGKEVILRGYILLSNSSKVLSIVNTNNETATVTSTSTSASSGVLRLGGKN